MSLKAARRMRAIASIVAALGASAAFATGASGADEAYCVGVHVAPGQHCDLGHNHHMYLNEVDDDGFGAFRVCAGAVQNGSFYGTYACGTGYANHCYSGSLLLEGRIHNGESFSYVYMDGYVTYSWDPCI